MRQFPTKFARRNGAEVVNVARSDNFSSALFLCEMSRDLQSVGTFYSAWITTLDAVLFSQSEFTTQPVIVIASTSRASPSSSSPLIQSRIPFTSSHNPPARLMRGSLLLIPSSLGPSQNLLKTIKIDMEAQKVYF